MTEDHRSAAIIERSIIEQEHAVILWPAHEEHFISHLAALELGIRAPHKTDVHLTLHLWCHIIELHPTCRITGVEGRLYGAAWRDGSGR